MRPPLGGAVILWLCFSGVVCQYPVWDFSMRHQFQRTVVRLQLLFADEVGIVIMEFPVYTGNGFDIRTNGSQIVGYHNDAQRFAQVFQYGIKFFFETAVNIGGGFVEHQYPGRGDDRTAKEYPLHLPSGKVADRRFFVSAHAVFVEHRSGFVFICPGVRPV